MPARRSSLDAIRAELAWVTETPDPNKCGCRNVRCCEETANNPERMCRRSLCKILDVPLGVLLRALPYMDGAEVRLAGT